MSCAQVLNLLPNGWGKDYALRRGNLVHWFHRLLILKIAVNLVPPSHQTGLGNDASKSVEYKIEHLVERNDNLL